MLFSFLALPLSMLYLNHCCNAKSLSSISSEKYGLVANSLRLLQNSEHEKHNHFCLSTGCVKAAASLINNMDQTVDPCDDFYQFACGNFIKNTILDDAKKLQNQFTVINDEIFNQIRMIVTEPIQPDELRPFKMMKLMFESCMDQEHIEKLGLGPIKEMLKSLGGWPVLEAEKWDESKFTWMDSMHKLIVPGQNKVDYFFKLSVKRNATNNTMTFLYLDKASLGLKSEYLVQGKDHEDVKKYYRYMVDIAVLFGADRQRATKELMESLDFEIELAKIEEQWDLSELVYQPLDLYEFIDLDHNLLLNTPWQELHAALKSSFIKQFDHFMQRDDITTTVVSSVKLLFDLEKLLNKTPKRVQANYVIRRSVIDSVSFLTEKLRKREYNFKKELDPDVIKNPRWKECVSISMDSFKLPIGSLYVRRFFNENNKLNILEMINDIMEEVYKILSSNEWMDDETKKNAINKAKSMTHNIAYPDELLDDNKLNTYYENLKINDQEFYTSVLNLTKFSTDYEFSKLRRPFNKSDWIYQSDWIVEVNAFYNPQDNNFILPAGILQDVFVSNDRPQYMIYGGFGSVISHEITHGFDNKGKQFDMHGNMVNWWAEETNKRFLEKENCFINQYANYTVHEVGLKVNGTLTLGDNMADNGGWKLTYYAYKEWVKRHGVEPRLPGLQEYTPQQMFWLSTANVWCSKTSPETQKDQITNDVHSPARFRVIGSLSNMKDFSQDFRCPLGSNMNPVKKCQVW